MTEHGQPTLVLIRGGYDKAGPVWRKKRYRSASAAIRAVMFGLALERAHQLLQTIQADLNERAMRNVSAAGRKRVSPDMTGEAGPSSPSLFGQPLTPLVGGNV